MDELKRLSQWRRIGRSSADVAEPDGRGVEQIGKRAAARMVAPSVARPATWATRVGRIVRAGILILALVVSLLLALTSVSTDVTDADRTVFETKLGLNGREKGNDYGSELRAIREVQHRVMKLAPVGAAIPDYAEREPADLIRQGSGLCYDRARTYDKVFKWLGFETRHLFILYKRNPQDSSGDERGLGRALFTPGQPSHAVTEVRTRRGWVVVESNSEWIGVDRHDEPVSADEIWRSEGRFDVAPASLFQPYWAIRGMYSRRGQLYKPYVPFPKFNLPDLFHWLVDG